MVFSAKNLLNAAMDSSVGFVVTTALATVLLFGFLIFIHEFGHYLTARLFKVTVKEFALGMGPKILSKRSKKTDIVYSLRALPIGGFVSMEGEDEESPDPNAFHCKAVWKRMIITGAGHRHSIKTILKVYVCNVLIRVRRVIQLISVLFLCLLVYLLPCHSRSTVPTHRYTGVNIDCVRWCFLAVECYYNVSCEFGWVRYVVASHVFWCG